MRETFAAVLVALVLGCSSSPETAVDASFGGRDAGRLDAETEDAGVDVSILHQQCAVDTDAANGCTRCLDDKCCSTRLACLNDPNCNALYACESDCRAGRPDEAGATARPPDGGDYSCDLWCGAPTNHSLGKFTQLLACSEILCQGASQCGGEDACTKCVDNHCVGEQLAISGTMDGYLFNECFGQCKKSDTACKKRCQSDYPGVGAALSALETCVHQACSVCE